MSFLNLGVCFGFCLFLRGLQDITKERVTVLILRSTALILLSSAVAFFFFFKEGLVFRNEGHKKGKDAAIHG